MAHPLNVADLVDLLQSKLNRLQRVQNRCIKALFQLPRLTSTTYLYTTSILPVEKLAAVERIPYLHKIVKSLVKHNFDIRLNSDIHSHRTRQGNDLNCPDKHPLLKQFTHEYNLHCKDLRHLKCVDVDTFKTKLKIEIMKNCIEYRVISPYLYLN